jgi:hypothetical protein
MILKRALFSRMFALRASGSPSRAQQQGASGQERNAKRDEWRGL